MLSLESFSSDGRLLKGGLFRFFFFFLYVWYSTLLHLPPLRFHCVGGCWDRTQDICDNDIAWLSDALTTRLDLIHTRLDVIHSILFEKTIPLCPCSQYHDFFFFHILPIHPFIQTFTFVQIKSPQETCSSLQPVFNPVNHCSPQRREF